MNDDLEERIKKAVDLFKRLREPHEKQLEYAYASRQRMIKEIEDGKRPSGYRYEFLANSADKVIDFLETVHIDSMIDENDHVYMIPHDTLEAVENVLKYQFEMDKV